jgi:hypothetical protein
MTRLVVDNFTWSSLANLLGLVKDNGFTFASFDDYQLHDRPCIIRHDVDASLECALDMARFEAQSCPELSATYFVLVTGDWYNIFSRQSRLFMQEIQSLGHRIGLHFDDSQYIGIADDPAQFRLKVREEAELLSHACETEVTCVSMHKPRRELLGGEYQVAGLLNAYSDTFFNEFKYVSDSAMRWRESVYDVISCGKHDKLQILTHPIWYTEEYKELRHRIAEIVGKGVEERYGLMDGTFNKLDAVIKESEITCEYPFLKS